MTRRLCCRRSRVRSDEALRPRIVTSPPLGRSRSASSASRVDLPLPRRPGESRHGVLVELGVDAAQGVGLAGGGGVDLDQPGHGGRRAGTVGGERHRVSPRHGAPPPSTATRSRGPCRPRRPAPRATSQPAAASSADPGTTSTAVPGRARRRARAGCCASGRRASSDSAARPQLSASTTATSRARARPGACRPAPVHASIRSAAGERRASRIAASATAATARPRRRPCRGRSGSGGPGPRRRRPASRAPARGWR